MNILRRKVEDKEIPLMKIKGVKLILLKLLSINLIKLELTSKIHLDNQIIQKYKMTKRK